MPTHAVPSGRRKLRDASCRPGDERSGDYTRQQLVRMNERFVERMKRAIKRGLEQCSQEEQYSDGRRHRPHAQERRPEEKRARAA
jgi:hypothetical protein